MPAAAADVRRRTASLCKLSNRWHPNKRSAAARGALSLFGPINLYRGRGDGRGR